MKRFSALFAGVAAALTLGVAGCMAVGDFFRGYAEGDASVLDRYDQRPMSALQRGAVTFRYSDFGALNTDTLETYATPWRLTAAAIALREVDQHGGELSLDRVRDVLKSYGFLYPESVGNWPENLQQEEPPLGAPLGMAVGVVRRSIPNISLTASNLTCAACHSGPTYDAGGQPVTNVAWIGAPNTSLNLEAYVLGLYEAFKFAAADEERLIGAMRQMFPETSDKELSTIRSFVLPLLRDRMAEIAATGGRPLEFVNGSPGNTNGVAALRMQLGVLPADSYRTARGFTSTPDLGSRGFRSALLYDGAYAPEGAAPQRTMRAADITEEHWNNLAEIAAFFTVPAMGQHPDHAIKAIDDANNVVGFLKTYAPPRFPGTIDRTNAEQGRQIFAARCSACHGTYDTNLDRPVLVEFPNWIGPFTTDPTRHEAIDQATVRAVEASAYGKRLIARMTAQYSAPPLSGLWLSAPYLHNGSVPTLWQLMNPDQRPVRFMVGGHGLDLADVGIAGAPNAAGEWVYPAGYRPWSSPAMIDTREKGFGNQGHEPQFEGMTGQQKRALIEYLKLL